jgi:hypothetical protein
LVDLFRFLWKTFSHLTRSTANKLHIG